MTLQNDPPIQSSPLLQGELGSAKIINTLNSNRKNNFLIKFIMFQFQKQPILLQIANCKDHEEMLLEQWEQR